MHLLVAHAIADTKRRLKLGERGNALKYMYVVFYIATPCFIAVPYAYSKSRPQDAPRPWTVFVRYFVFFVFEGMLAFLYVIIIIPTFFNSGTRSLLKFFLRFGSQALFLTLSLELAWIMTKNSLRMGVKATDSTVCHFGSFAISFSFLGRLMQGSAETPAQR